MVKVSLRNSLVGFAVIAANTCASANQLIDQTVVCGITRDFF